MSFGISPRSIFAVYRWNGTNQIFFFRLRSTHRSWKSESEKFVVYLSYFHIVLSFNVSLQWHKTNKPDDKIKIKQATHHTQPNSNRYTEIYNRLHSIPNTFMKKIFIEILWTKKPYKMKLCFKWKCTKRQTLRDHCIVYSLSNFTSPWPSQKVFFKHWMTNEKSWPFVGFFKWQTYASAGF